MRAITTDEMIWHGSSAVLVCRAIWREGAGLESPTTTRLLIGDVNGNICLDWSSEHVSGVRRIDAGPHWSVPVSEKGVSNCV